MLTGNEAVLVLDRKVEFGFDAAGYEGIVTIYHWTTGDMSWDALVYDWEGFLWTGMHREIVHDYVGPEMPLNEITYEIERYFGEEYDAHNELLMERG